MIAVVILLIISVICYLLIFTNLFSINYNNITNNRLKTINNIDDIAIYKIQKTTTKR